MPDSSLTVNCPYCAEPIPSGIHVCPHCGNTVSAGVLATTVRAPVAAPQRKGTPWGWIIFVLLLIGVGVFVYTQMGVYSIQPIGALPDGITVVYWRSSGEPFFNSPDATCLRIQDGVSLLCRLGAMVQAPVDRVVVRLPYQEWAYLLSTGGVSFEQ